MEKEQEREMEAAHAEGLHDEIAREFCPLCPRCSVCGGEHSSIDCPSLNAMEVI